jgi:hypothetical protein
MLASALLITPPLKIKNGSGRQVRNAHIRPVSTY